MLFDDRADAGRRLAQRLQEYRGKDVVVLGLTRGGVPVAFEVAKALGAPLDVILVRKLGVPRQPELAFGAIGEDGIRVIDAGIVRRAGLTPTDIERVDEAQRVELNRRIALVRGKFARIPLDGRTVIIVDDGVATGSTARAACQVARAHGAAHVVLAVPIGSPRTIGSLLGDADSVVCLESPAGFAAVGQGYRNFAPTRDEDVMELCGRARAEFRKATASQARTETSPGRDAEVEVPVGAVTLAGHLTIPAEPTGIVVFAHGSGSSRHSPRNRYVAQVLNQAGLATLLFDLLTPDEEGNRALVFDIGRLAHRLVEVTSWLMTQPDTARLPIGYFGASTGAGAALRAATDARLDIRAVVSRGGRPDLAGELLSKVHTPTLLIVGGRDEVVLDLNRRARAAMPCECRIAIVPGATHVFPEPGTLEQAAALARDWFTTYLSRTTQHPPLTTGV